MDTDAIEAARRGDCTAQAALLRQLQEPWFRMCLSLLGNPDRARDATQETALRFLKQLGGFRGQCKLTTWSMGIAINVVREMRRKGGREVSDDDRIAEATSAGEEGPGELAVIGEAREAVRAVLDGLPERQREAVVLRFFEALSVEETAAAMGCAEGTVKATVFQALRSLRKRLGQFI